MGPSATPLCVGFLRVPSSIASAVDLLWLFWTDCLDLGTCDSGVDAGVWVFRSLLVCALSSALLLARVTAVRTDVCSE